jgi:hypothetical protein
MWARALFLGACLIGAAEAQRPLTAEEARALAASATGFHLVVSTEARRLWVVNEKGDTVRTASVAVGTGRSMQYGSSRWRFETPLGMRTVLRRDVDPVWIAPDWHFIELATQLKLNVAVLDRDVPSMLTSGKLLTVRHDTVGVMTGTDTSTFSALPVDEPLIDKATLFIPPLGTVNRLVLGELGKFRLDLGGGVALHGTPHKESIGKAATHGCIRLLDDDIAWLYEHVAVGTQVFIY